MVRKLLIYCLDIKSLFMLKVVLGLLKLVIHFLKSDSLKSIFVLGFNSHSKLNVIYLLLWKSLITWTMHFHLRLDQKGPKTKWVLKITCRALCSFLSFKASTSKGCWYLNHGCSRYIIGNIFHFKSVIKIDHGTQHSETTKRLRSMEKIKSVTIPFTLMTYFMLKVWNIIY